MTRGEVLARGNTADVIVWAAGAVAKVLHSTTPDEWAAMEATAVQLVRGVGVPVPAVLDVISVRGRPAVVFERIDGPSMWDVARDEPGRAADLARDLADLQHAITGIVAPAGVSDLRDRLRSKIGLATPLSPADRAEALALLDAMPGGDRLCHGDLHPGNVIVGRDGPVVVDWFDAAAGDPFADVARTSLLVRPPSRALARTPHLPGASRALLRRFHDAYLGRVAELRGCVREAFAWEPVVAAGRLSERVPREDLLRLWSVRAATRPAPPPTHADLCRPAG